MSDTYSQQPQVPGWLAALKAALAPSPMPQFPGLQLQNPAFQGMFPGAQAAPVAPLISPPSAAPTPTPAPLPMPAATPSLWDTIKSGTVQDTINKLTSGMSSGKINSKMFPEGGMEGPGAVGAIWSGLGQQPQAPAAPGQVGPIGNQNPVDASGVTPPRVQSRAPIAPTGGGFSFSLPTESSGQFTRKVNAAEGTGQNPRSSAAGKFQFTDGTFADFIKNVHPELEGQDLKALKASGQYQDEAFSWLTNTNAKTLAKKGIPVNDTTLYGAHFLGSADLAKVWAADPKTPVAQLGLAKGAIESNPEILAGKTAGEVKAWLERKMSITPAPPAAGTPPAMAAPNTLDFSGAKAWLDKAAPVAPTKEQLNAGHLQQVLGGLAAGAGSVDSTSPGSLAKTLAMMGAGGAQGFTRSSEGQQARMDKFQEANRQYAGQRAGAEFNMITAAHANEKEQNQVAFQNAKSVYDTNIANSMAQYEHKLKEFNLQLPKVHSDANGMTIQQMNPQTGTMDIKFHSTKTILDHAEKMTELVKSLGMPGPVAESMLIQHIASTIKDPVLANSVLEKEAVRRTIANGAGSAVFGKAYEQALKAAEKTSDPSGILKAKNPLEYQKILEEQAASMIYNSLSQKGDRSWLKAAARNGSTIAGVLAGGE